MDLLALALPLDLGDVRMLDPARLVFEGDPTELTRRLADGRTQAARFAAARADLERLAAGWRPDASDLAGAALIDGWAFTLGRGLSVAGHVRGHPFITDGHWALTSNLIALDVAHARWLRTVSRFYILGRPEGVAIN
jgi:hypothetical protein